MLLLKSVWVKFRFYFISNITVSLRSGGNEQRVHIYPVRLVFLLENYFKDFPKCTTWKRLPEMFAWILNTLFSLLNTLKDPLERGCSSLKATPPSPRPEASHSAAAQGRRENDWEATATTRSREINHSFESDVNIKWNRASSKSEVTTRLCG